MILYSDLICMVLVFYVWIRVYRSIHMEKSSKLAFYFSGVGLVLILVLDFIWEYMYFKLPYGESRRFWMNFVVTVMYMLLPLTVSTPMICYNHEKGGPRYRWVAVLIGFYLLSAVINIFHPIFFSHTNEGMKYTALTPYMYLACLLLFVFVTLEVYAHKFSFDQEDKFMICISVSVNVIGIAAAQFAQDLLTLWLTMSLSYLFLYLAIEEMYAKTDPITGLKNRNAYTKQMRRIRAKERFILAVFDTNDLKKYNDTMGHLAGDEYLRYTALTLKSALKTYGILYRTGGDEFCLVSYSEGWRIEECLQKLFQQEAAKTVGKFRLDVAYGIAVRAEDEAIKAVADRADQEMYRNKMKIKQERLKSRET